MEFLLYLDNQGQQLIRDLISARFSIQENIGLCKNPNIFGYTESPKKFIVCTKNIKKGGWDVNQYIPETVYHEAVHAAQLCVNNEPLGISTKNMPLSANKMQDVRNSVNTIKSYKALQREHEAYFFEDKPNQVHYYVRKFCF